MSSYKFAQVYVLQNLQQLRNAASSADRDLVGPCNLLFFFNKEGVEASVAVFRVLRHLDMCLILWIPLNCKSSFSWTQIKAWLSCYKLLREVISLLGQLINLLFKLYYFILETLVDMSMWSVTISRSVIRFGSSLLRCNWRTHVSILLL